MSVVLYINALAQTCSPGVSTFDAATAESHQPLVVVLYLCSRRIIIVLHAGRTRNVLSVFGVCL